MAQRLKKDGTPAKKTGVKAGELTNIDKAAITTAKANPEMNDYEISKYVTDIGVASQKQNVYRRLKHSELLQLTLAEIRQQHQAQILYDLAPIALKNTKKALKNKELPVETRYKYDKMVLDKVTPDEGAQPQVNVNIHQLGVLIGRQLKGDDD